MYGYCGGGYPEYEGGYEKNGNQKLNICFNRCIVYIVNHRW